VSRDHQQAVLAKRHSAFFRLLDELAGTRLDVPFEELAPRWADEPRYLQLSTTDPETAARILFDQYMARKVRRHGVHATWTLSSG
jgi:hypothetical protein